VVSTLCKSMCGLDLQLLTVEHKMSRLASHQRQKRFIIINTRTHSGEASASWVLDGLLMELGGSVEVLEWLLAENICLKIVPMLNPDGVFIGNYRTGIVGDDFNRKFHSGRKEFYP
jgi:murein tripeptide amidase MpaA